LSLVSRALKDKFPTPAVPLTTVLQNRQVFLPDPVYSYNKHQQDALFLIFVLVEMMDKGHAVAQLVEALRY